jgi:NitT/TauT family transport system substrate-binding protein
MVCVISALLVLCVAASGCSRKEPPAKQAGPLVSVRICQGGIVAPLLFIAREKGLFRSEGIQADISIVGDGKTAMGAFLDGRCEIALVGETPIVRQSFTRNDFVIIASVVSSDSATKILARRDRGISRPEDLAGKRVAVSKGTLSHFFLDQFLKKNHIPPEKLTVVDLLHSDMAAALQRGDIDAFAGTDFAYLKGSRAIGAGGVTFSEPGLTTHAASLVVKADWLRDNQPAARGLLKALIAAEKELAGDPDAVAARLANEHQMRQEDLKSVMALQSNSVTLDQVLILSLEDQARWMQETGLEKGKGTPNYLKFLSPSILRDLRPESVNLK